MDQITCYHMAFPSAVFFVFLVLLLRRYLYLDHNIQIGRTQPAAVEGLQYDERSDNDKNIAGIVKQPINYYTN